MTVKELYKFLDQKIPRSLSCEWDNDGLMCCPDGDREVRRVLVSLDATADIADAAIKGGYDLILTHHPFIFKGLKSINGDSFISEKAIKLIRAGISVMSFHTRLDAVEGGVNDVLAGLVGLENTSVFGEKGLGRIGDLREPCSLEDLAKKVKEVLGAPFVSFAGGNRVCSRVAVLGGGGADDMYEAIAAGADTYISGNLSFHGMTDAADIGINLIEAGHFYTENPVCRRLCELVYEADGNTKCDILNSNRIEMI